MSQSPTAAPDVLVAGAGPVGLALAAELLRHGVSCRIVDQGEGPSIWSKAAVVHVRTLEAFEAMGVVDEALRRGRKIHGIRAMAGTHCLGRLAVGGLDSPYPFILGLSQRETEEILAERVEALGGVVERRVELESFTRDGETVEATLIHDGGRREVVRVPFLCGCDGAHSRVRQTLGLSFEGTTYEEAVLQADVRIRWPTDLPDDEVLLFMSPKGSLAAFPVLSEGRYRLVTLIPPETEIEPTLAHFQRLMDARGPAGTVVEDPAWMVPFRFHRRMARRCGVDNVFLCGDAAHIHSPVGGQGMNTGIQDAFNLGWKLALVIRGRGRPALLDSYEAERRPVAAAILASTDLATRLALPLLRLKNPLARALRDVAMALGSRLPLVESRFARALGGLNVAYAPSPILAEDVAPRGIADRIAFARAPRPGERVADARLSAIIRGTGHTLLLFGGLHGSDDGPRRLADLGAWIAERRGEAVRPILVTAAGPTPEGMVDVVRDTGGALHRRFGARGECLYLIRPDGRVGYRSLPVNGERLAAYLGRIFR